MDIFRTLERIKTWHFFLFAVLIAEIFTFVLTLIQSILRGRMISSELAEIGAIDAIFVSLIVTFILLPIIRYSAKMGLEKQILQKEIAERKRIEAALRESEFKYRELVENANSIILRWNSDGEITFLNEFGCKFFGYREDEILGRNVIGTVTPETESTGQDFRPLMEIICRNPSAFEGNVIENMLRDGRRVWIAWTNRAVFDSGGVLIEVLSIGTDITERKKMEEALKRSHEELELQVMERTAELETAYDRLRNLAAHLQTIREDDRRSIARDIHDELGQTLTAMKIDLSWVHNRYADHKPLFDKVGAKLDRLDATILSVKRICTELRPSLLDDFGLVAAMEWLADEFQDRTGIECTVIEEPSGIYLDKERSIAFFRIFQEALTNVLKHAKATKVTARLIDDDDHQVTLEVMDNGEGITDGQLSKPQSFGLIGMRERVYPWRGKVEIASDKGRGSTVRVTVPLSNIRH